MVKFTHLIPKPLDVETELFNILTQEIQVELRKEMIDSLAKTFGVPKDML
jgi:hypothetical protein